MEQEAKEVVLTYETLYETLRKEKSREELQPLDDGFFTDVLTYLREKQQAYDDNLAKNDIFSQSERDKLHIQLSNIKKILKDLYDIRERKTISMAINKSRTNANIVDETNLLVQEKALFESLSTVLTQHRIGILHRVLELREPDVLPVILPNEPRTAVPVRPAPPQAEKAPDPDTLTLKFVESVDQFVGEELELYGPFEEGDNAVVPKKIGKLLIEQGAAIQV